jgi:hypothetical protein
VSVLVACGGGQNELEEMRRFAVKQDEAQGGSEIPGGEDFSGRVSLVNPGDKELKALTLDLERVAGGFLSAGIYEVRSCKSDERALP